MGEINMDKREILHEINKAKEHLANMEKALDECKYERWKPENNETYYFVNSCDEVEETWRSSINFIPDIKRYNTYNCFETKEQAKQEAEKILVRRMLEDIARRLNKCEKIDWKGKYQSKYFIYLNNEEDELCYADSRLYKFQNVVYCLDPCFLDVAIQEIGEERLKKYLRGE